MEKAYFAAGCFWGVEHIFAGFNGVLSTSVGYGNGKTKDPTYRDICSGLTGHAEMVEVCYESNKISYKKLVEIFYDLHDPTTINRQGPDIGSQYRSGIYFLNQQQQQIAIEYTSKHQQSLSEKIVTEIVPLESYYLAEEYHQQYFKKNPERAICHVYSPSNK